MLSSPRLTFLAVPALAAAMLFASGCGDDDSSDSSAESDTASTEEVTVTATEYEFDLSATPTADTKSVVFSDEGEEGHALIFARINEGFTTEEAIKLQGEKGSADVVGQANAGPGKEQTVEVKGPLEAGSYAMICPLETKDGEPHYELGQLEEFEIE